VRPPSSRSPLVRRSSSSQLRLSTIDFELVNAARRILEGSLSVVPGERVVVVVDRAREDLVPPLQEVARLTGAQCDVIVLEDVGTRPLRELPPIIDERIRDAQATILLAAFVEGEHPMRLALLERVRELGLRHAHMLGVTRRAMVAGLSVDPARIVDTTRAVRMRLRPNSVLRSRSASGTDLTVEIDPNHRWVEHVGVIRGGRWENLPSGELMTSPKNVSGVFVCDASVSGTFGGGGLLTRTPLRLDIEDSVVKSVACNDSNLQRAIEGVLSSDHFTKRVGTVFLGTNVGLLEPIGETVCDQNLPGLHISLGSTYADVTGAPFTTAAYVSLTAAGGDVDLDGAPLLRAGRYIL
jgi:leucyl aminopeptidase (aminopeptidase T)